MKGWCENAGLFYVLH